MPAPMMSCGPDKSEEARRSAAEGSASVASSLLAQVKAMETRAWQELVDLYGPVVYSWCRQQGLRAEDAADVGQEVFAAVARSVATFRRDRPGDSFRGWLWAITRSKLCDHWRRRAAQPEAAGGSSAQQRLQEAPDPASADQTSSAPGGVVRISPEILGRLQQEFKPNTWQAFWRVTVEGQAPTEVAAELRMSPGAVYIAKSRVLHRLREALGDLMDD